MEKGNLSDPHNLKMIAKWEKPGPLVFNILKKRRCRTAGNITQ